MSTAVIQDFTSPDYLNVAPIVTSERKAFLRNVWHLIAPDIELQYGIYNSTVAAPAAIFSQALLDTLDKWRSHTQIAQLVQDVQENREINAPYLELFLENYRIKRQAGTNSVGLIRLIFKDNVNYTVGVSETFTARGITFRPTRNFNIVPTSGNLYTPNSQALQPLDDGNYEAVIEVRSDTAAVAANLPSGTQLIQENNTNSPILEAVVIDSFVGGIQEETVETLVPQLVNGITSPILTSRANIAAQLKTISNITVKDVSVIGLGDIESLRDKHGLFAISYGGRGDIYVRTAGTLLTKTIQKTCRLVRVNQDTPHTAVYRCTLSRLDAPAAYSITSVLSDVSSHKLNIIHESRGFDLNNHAYAPDIINYIEAAFSAYQTITFEFEDDGMERFGEQSNYPQNAEYSITYDYQPHIDSLQEHCINRSNIPVMGDLLVKAAIPCKTKVHFSVAVQQSQAAPNIQPLITSVINTVSSTGFMNVLPASVIIEAIQRLLPDGMFVSDFVMTGSLLLPTVHVPPNGLVTLIEYAADANKEELAFEVLPYATANTICFFTDANDATAEIKRYNSVARMISN